MRTFLLIVGILLILVGFIAAAQTLRLMNGVYAKGAFTPTYPADIHDAVFCAVLYGAGFGSLYLRHRITTPT